MIVRRTTSPCHFKVPWSIFTVCLLSRFLSNWLFSPIFFLISCVLVSCFYEMMPLTVNTIFSSALSLPYWNMMFLLKKNRFNENEINTKKLRVNIFIIFVIQVIINSQSYVTLSFLYKFLTKSISSWTRTSLPSNMDRHQYLWENRINEHSFIQ